MTARRLLGAAAVLVALVALPARAQDPVLDDASREELAAQLAEATEVQGVCYGYSLSVTDESGGGWGGTYTTSSLGAGVLPEGDPRCPRTVVLHAWLEYTSDWSESYDSASWQVVSDLAGPRTEDLGRLGLRADDLTDDGASERTLVAAVLALPVLTADAGLAPAVTEDPSSLPAAPADARATDRPGGDWLRENGTALAVLLGLMVGAAVWASTTTPVGHRRARAVWRVLSD